ncbi:MAG: hypothetical protein ABL908_00225 [Hyphomicrobium sp.]
MTRAGGYFHMLPEHRDPHLDEVPMRGATFEPYWPGRPSAECTVKDAEAQRQASFRQAVDEAYARGHQEGTRVKSVEMEELVAQSIANCEVAVASAEASFIDNHAQHFSSGLAAGLDRIGVELDAAVAEVIGPLIKERMARDLVEDAMCALARVADAATATTVTIRGPDRFVKALAEDLQKKGIGVVAHVDEGSELAIAIDGTLIRARMQDWLRKLEGALQ